VADPRIDLSRGNTDASRGGALGVVPWGEPTGAVIASVEAARGSSPGNVADPRVEAHQAIELQLMPASGQTWFKGVLGVTSWGNPSFTVAGESYPGNGPFSVADPLERLPELQSPLAEGQKRREGWKKYDVRGWGDTAGTVTGPGTNGAGAVADPGVEVRDSPDLSFGCQMRAGAYRVIHWRAAAHTITGSLRIDNGPAAVADERIREALKKKPTEPTILISDDGTWHRPFTTMELGALQGLPIRINGKPLKLAGKSHTVWRKHIGNCVPVGAAQAFGSCMAKALLASKLGGWFFLSSEMVWVRRDGRAREDVAFDQPELTWEITSGHAGALQ
jgi:hypothetical protein